MTYFSAMPASGKYTRHFLVFKNNLSGFVMFESREEASDQIWVHNFTNQTLVAKTFGKDTRVHRDTCHMFRVDMARALWNSLCHPTIDNGVHHALTMEI